MSIEQHIEDIITSALLDKGFGVVRVQLQGSKRKTLQIMIERLDETNITVDDCADVTHIASALLDVNDPIHESYTLEVSSPGMDRPLVKLSDFERFSGSAIKVELKTPYEGSRRFQGILQGIEKNLVKVKLIPTEKDGKFNIAEFAFSDIQKAKLIPDYKA
ncbi:MAG: ribosome maturation factor RimP [Proteobacteria bacterium]|nr:ribosome maturation factor RimP [Pseudomonadota bacterium]